MPMIQQILDRVEKHLANASTRENRNDDLKDLVFAFLEHRSARSP